MILFLKTLRETINIKKPQTWYMSMKVFFKKHYDIFYVVENVVESAF